MKILDYGDKTKKPRVMGCVECNAKFELEADEPNPRKCPVCGASGHSLYNVDEKVQDFNIITGFPNFYSSWNMDFTIVNTEKVRDMIRSAVRAYYDGDGRYAVVEGRGLFVAIFQQDPDDKDDYSVYITNSYATVNSLTFEA